MEDDHAKDEEADAYEELKAAFLGLEDDYQPGGCASLASLRENSTTAGAHRASSSAPSPLGSSDGSSRPRNPAEGGGKLRSPLVEGIRLSLFVVLSIGQADERETVPFIEATRAQVLLEDPESESGRATFLRRGEECGANTSILLLSLDV
jgi:hypothetical protein